jgi:type I restriction enzyme R subunit
MNKKALTEADICTKFITPAIVGKNGSKWNVMTQILEEHTFTDGRIIVRGEKVSRGEKKRADYILLYQPNLPLAVVEAKDNNHSVGAGMQQALDYAEILDVPFAYSSNGDAFIEHDRIASGGTVEREIPLDQFPTSAELWSRYCTAKGYTTEQADLVTQPYDDSSGKTPRYYQHVAINRTVDAIVRGEKRILLVMATGTGKTLTAFQIIWRLWKAGAAKRILFLVDRNNLADQTKTNDFKHFGNAMTKITKRKVDQAYEIYLSLYQAVTGSEEEQNIYKQFPPDFFDLVVVDECHRGSAADDAAWRQVLEYFSSATQIGLTATPKETREVSNIEYFGEPLYTYSLKQGISDGFLAPYKVVRVGLDKDLDGWRPDKGKVDKFGQEIEDREYNALDYDRSLILEKRTELVAAKVTEFLNATDRFSKTIVFCQNIDHAERMRRALVNANADLAAANRKYVMRITGDSPEGKAELDNFIDPEATHPVIATTSQLMSTGVDSQTCKLIVLDKSIGSMTEFKQIIGRGTRIKEEYDKLFFTIMDFKQATKHFADPDFDGDPVQIYEPATDESVVPPDDFEEEPADDDDPARSELLEFLLGAHAADIPSGITRYYVDDVKVAVVTERVQYLDAEGKLITESLKDYTRKTVRKAYTSLDAFLGAWNEAQRKQAIIEELVKQGVFLEELSEQVGHDYDTFDLVCHVAFDQPPLTRRERADRVKKRHVFAQYGEQARAVLQALLEKYADGGIRSVESLEILKVAPLSDLGTPVEIVRFFGGKPGYLAALHELETALYQKAA